MKSECDAPNCPVTVLGTVIDHESLSRAVKEQMPIVHPIPDNSGKELSSLVLPFDKRKSLPQVVKTHEVNAVATSLQLSSEVYKLAP